jgi:hypothetical protein
LRSAKRPSLDYIACGCHVDHPDFDTMLKPFFDQTLVRLLEDAGNAKWGTIASTTLTIARARYTISAKCKGDWLNFAVDAFSAFEQVSAEIMDRTVLHLNDTLALHLSPRGVGAKMN